MASCFTPNPSSIQFRMGKMENYLRLLMELLKYDLWTIYLQWVVGYRPRHTPVVVWRGQSGKIQLAEERSRRGRRLQLNQLLFTRRAFPLGIKMFTNFQRIYGVGFICVNRGTLLVCRSHFVFIYSQMHSNQSNARNVVNKISTNFRETKYCDTSRDVSECNFDRSDCSVLFLITPNLIESELRLTGDE